MFAPVEIEDSNLQTKCIVYGIYCFQCYIVDLYTDRIQSEVIPS